MKTKKSKTRQADIKSLKTLKEWKSNIELAVQELCGLFYQDACLTESAFWATANLKESDNAEVAEKAEDLRRRLMTMLELVREGDFLLKDWIEAKRLIGEIEDLLKS